MLSEEKKKTLSLLIPQKPDQLTDIVKNEYVIFAIFFIKVVMYLWSLVILSDILKSFIGAF